MIKNRGEALGFSVDARGPHAYLWKRGQMVFESILYAYTSFVYMKISGTPPLPCLCANIRRASRAITQRYEEALRPVGLTITQFTILQAVSLLGDITQRRLGEILAMD
jgi:hypothetical protein